MNESSVEFREPALGGHVADGFEPVRAAFRDNFRERGELGAACAVYYRGEKVVDLWGGYRDRDATEHWEEDTLVLVFSATKGLAGIAMAMAHSRGHYDYEDAVSAHWSAFGQNGKQSITVRELLNHQGGVAAIDQTLTPERIARRSELMDGLAAKQPDWTPGARHGYHAWSLGWYESELLRRTDPKERGLAEFFEEEIAQPLDLEFYIGLPDEVDEERVASIEGISPVEMLTNLNSVPWKMVLALCNPWSVTRRAMAPFDIGSPAELNRPDYRSVPIPSGNGIGQVRDIAKVYGTMAVDAETVGIGPDTMDELTTTPSIPEGGADDVVLKMESRYQLGFWKPFEGFDFGSSAAFGVPGAGGALAFADPARELGFAYAPNRMGSAVLDDPRGAALRDAVERSIDARA